MKAGEKSICPQCKGEAVNITPLKEHDRSLAIFCCKKKGCGFTFKADGGAYVKDPNELKDWFSGVIKGNQALTELLMGEKLNPATRNLFLARITEYGLQMWNEGFKQGLLVNALQQHKEE